MRENYKSKYKVYKTYQKRFTSPFLGKFFLLDEDTITLDFVKPKKSLFKRILLDKLEEKRAYVYHHINADPNSEPNKHRDAYFTLLRYFDEWFEFFYRFFKKYELNSAIEKSFIYFNATEERIPQKDLWYVDRGLSQVFMTILKFAVVKYVSNQADSEIIIVTKTFVEEVFVEVEYNVAGWVFDTRSLSKKEIDYLKDCSIIYNVPVIFDYYDATINSSGKIGGYYHRKDEFHVEPETEIIDEINKEIRKRKEFEKIPIKYDSRKPKQVSCIAKLSDLGHVNYEHYSGTTYVMLEAFLYKFHTYNDIFKDLMIKLSQSQYQRIILKMPHLKKEYVKGSIRMDDEEGLEYNQYNKNIDLYDPLFSSFRYIENKEVQIAFPFIRDEEEFKYHRNETRLFLEALNININKFGTLLQTDALTYNVDDINRWNKFQFAVLDSNEIFEEVYDRGRFESFEYFEYLRIFYPEIRDLHQNLDKRSFEQYFHGYILSQPRLARKMYSCGIKNMILYKSQEYNYHHFILKDNRAQHKN